MRTLRRLIDIAVPLLGIALVLGAVLFIVELRVQIVVVVVGILIIEAGIWKVAHPLLPNERKYFALREEGDQFIRLIRRLNRTALDAKANDNELNRAALAAVRADMIEAVDRMIGVAGKTEEEVRRTTLVRSEATV